MKPLFLVLLLCLLIGCEKEQPPVQFIPYVWETASAAAVGMDQQQLDSAFIVAADKGYIDGLLIVKNGSIVAEGYYNGYDREEPHNIMSVSKSMLSAIAGLALNGEYGLDLHDKMMDYFPEYVSNDLDPRINNVTIQHLLTMRMGIAGEAENNYGVYSQLYHSDNWIRNTIESPLIADPGEAMHYNTFITHLLSGVITKATRESTKLFADRALFVPMGIDIDSWEQDPQGIYFGGNSMYVTPREMAVFGLLYLNDGALNGKQIMPASWVEQSLQPSTSFTHPNHWGSWKNYNYASLWWLGEFNGYHCFMGYGYGGQFLIVFPDLDLIIVSTARFEVAPDDTNEQEWSIFELVTRYILPSLS